MAAHFLSSQYGAPPILFALLLGASLSFLATDERIGPGLEFTATIVLGIGVMLLGGRVTAADVAELGWSTAALVFGAVVCSVLVGWAIGRLCGLRNDHAVLSAAAVAICGTAAALAVATVLPERKNREANTLVTAIGVTVLGSIAMILYPLLVGLFGFDELAAGVFLGATIHNVAQVVGAGHMVSDAAGEAATLVKLLRVAMLIPVVALIALVFRSRVGVAAQRRPLVPWFLTGFAVVALSRSLDAVPLRMLPMLAEASSACIIVAVAALGVKTSVKDLLRVGPRPVAALVAQTLFLALFVGAWLIVAGWTQGS
ncbi:MAG: putative sulfate exporter family transporter [Phycisphaerales bacterium]|nr:putative sulfate exporter family transporter [Phycisphaerales bacterium]